MHNIYIAGTGIWHPKEKISNDELVNSYNSYVEKFNKDNKSEIENGTVEALEFSSAEFIETKYPPKLIAKLFTSENMVSPER